jgi:D-arabinose 1-dehydrogenase-like Zn-dependent alcohol dehydrogenase
LKRRTILATAPDAKAIASLVEGLSVGGKLVVVGVSQEPFAVSSAQLIPARKSIMG